MSFIRFCEKMTRMNISPFFHYLLPQIFFLFITLQRIRNPFITCKYCGAWLDTVEPRKPCKNSRINSHALPGTTQGLYSTYSTQMDEKNNKDNNFFYNSGSWMREVLRKIMDLFFLFVQIILSKFKLGWKRGEMEVIDKILNVIRSKVPFRQ